MSKGLAVFRDAHQFSTLYYFVYFGESLFILVSFREKICVLGLVLTQQLKLPFTNSFNRVLTCTLLRDWLLRFEKGFAHDGRFCAECDTDGVEDFKR